VKCYRHPDRDAVAACKHCVKALCGGCAHEAEGGMSCGGTCAEMVQMQHDILIRSSNALSHASVQAASAGWFVVLMGGAMAIVGWLMGSNFALVIGAMMFALGVVGLVAVRRKQAVS
jgi:hypothetical protein